MKITFLGTGTSNGIPVVGCRCDVCRSESIKNKRYRSSLFIETGESRILIDTATEFRLQAVRENIDHIDFVLITHSHADHIHGLDDLRTLTWKKKLDLYGNREAISDMKSRFNYIFKKGQTGGGKPDISFNFLDKELYFGKNSDGNIISGTEEILSNLTGSAAAGKIIPVPVKHGDLDIYGYRIGKFAYITDCNFIPDESMELLKGIEVITLGALRYRPHSTHFSVDQAVEAIIRTGAKRGYLTHFCHDIDHEKLSEELPDNIKPAFDTLKIYI